MQDLLGIGTNRRESMIGTGIGLGLAGYRLNPPGVLPVLDLRFATDKSLTAFAGPTPSFSRASSGTYFDANGVLQSAGVNAARFNHVYNGTSWVSRGLLVEEQRTNICTYSEQLSHASWAFLSNATTSANAANAPDGNTTADLIYPTANGASCYVGKDVGSISAGVIHTNSFFLKSSGKTWARVYSIRGDFGAWFNLSSGTVGTTLSGSVASIQNVGNGWYRCSVARTTEISTGYTFVGPSDSDNSSAVTSNGTDGILVWGAQTEVGSFATSYILTSSSTVTRSADVCQITGSDFSGFWNGTEGSFAVEYDRIGYASGAYPPINYAYKTSSPGGDVIALTGNNNAGGGESFWVAATSFQAQIVAGSMLAAGVAGKIAACYKVNDFAATLNGAAAVTDTSGTLPTVDAMAIGRNGDGSAYGNCHIARLRYYRTRLENGTLRVLST